MCLFSKNHPFAVEAFFTNSLVLAFAVPKEEVTHLIPECLEPDTLNDRWAFVAMAMVETKKLRPKSFPALFGSNFFLIGYRIFVRYINMQGKRLRGLYILKSETDKKRMECLGNIFTHYNYATTDITQIQKDNTKIILSSKSAFHIKIKIDSGEIPLPQGSPFSDWKEARRFAGPLPFTFSYNADAKKVLIVEGVRQNWKPAPVKVMEHHISFLDSFNFTDVRLANAFIIQNTPYYWKKGRAEPWRR